MADVKTENRISPQMAPSSIEKTEGDPLTVQPEILLKKYQFDIQANPKDDGLFVQRAKLYIKLAKGTNDKHEQRLILQLALHDYAKAIQLAKTKADYYAERAEIYQALRYFKQAVADCLKADHLHPGNANFQARLRKLQLLNRQATVVNLLRRIRQGVDIMTGGILCALMGAFIWGLGEIIYGIPFMLIAFISFIYGLVKVLKSEISLDKLHH